MAFRLIWTPRVKKLLIFAIAYTAFVVAGGMYIRYRFDTVKGEIQKVLDVADRCGKLRLRMERSDVLQIMGPPVKEYDVRPAGKGSEALYREMLYAYPNPAITAPYVDLDLEKMRVVEVFCSKRQHMVMPENARLDMEQEKPVIPSAQ